MKVKSKLEVEQGLQIAAGAGAGQVLTSDASGNAAWSSGPVGVTYGAFSVLVGDGSATSFVVNHNLGTRAVAVVVSQAGTPYQELEASWAATDAYNVTVTLTTPPTLNSVRVTVLSGSGPAGPTGPAGANLITGSGAPAGGTGSNGDTYLDTATGRVYGPKAAGSWPAYSLDLVTEAELTTGLATKAAVDDPLVYALVFG
jgi:hypothetical protein